jgi:hypothetical protein
MRAPALIVLAGLCLGMSACATTPMTSDTPDAPVAAGGPAPVEGRDWFYQSDDQDARLVYGQAETDDVQLGLGCRRASGRLELSAVAERTAAPELYLESGGETERYPARSEPSELHDGVILTAEAATDGPVFQRFRRVGWIALWQDGERYAYAPHPGSAPGIERFFAFCG